MANVIRPNPCRRATPHRTCRAARASGVITAPRALCDNDTLFQAGLGIFPAIAGGNPGYQFQVDLYIASLPIPNPFNSQLYNVMNWQAHYQSAALTWSATRTALIPLAPVLHWSSSLTNQSAMNLFGGPICGIAWPTIMVRY